MNTSDTQLILKAQQGDMSAFEELVYRYDRQVLNIAKSFRNSDDDAKDIYQEVFIRVFRGIKNFQFKSEFSTWLFRITTNVCISYQNGKKNTDSIDKEISGAGEESFTIGDLLPSDDFADKAAILGDTQKHINNALNTLPPQQKMAFTLRYYDEFKIKEIAEIMQCTEGTIKKYIFTASDKMRKKLKSIF
jgi:RNA polymerase sigma-70 factor, ECF subfamily